jgi:hypothetical protein
MTKDPIIQLTALGGVKRQNEVSSEKRRSPKNHAIPRKHPAKEHVTRKTNAVMNHCNGKHVDQNT